MLPVLQGSCFARDDVFSQRYYDLGNIRLDPLRVCGDTLQGMLDVLSGIHKRILDCDEAGVAPTPISKYRHACTIFGVDPDSVVPPARIRQLLQRTVFRLVRLFSAIQDRIESQGVVLEDTAAGAEIGESASNRTRVRDKARVTFIGTAKALDMSAQLMLFMVSNYAALTPTSNITVRFPAMAFNIMDMNANIKPLMPSQCVERNILMTIFNRDLRRMGSMVLQPHTVTTASGRSVHTHTYRYYKTIRKLVEELTSLTSDAEAWGQRGVPKFIVESLENADTYLFPDVKVSQGVYSCRDAIIDSEALRFYLYDDTLPQAQQLLATVAAAVAALKARIEVHEVALVADEPSMQLLFTATQAAAGTEALAALQRGMQEQERVQVEAQQQQAIAEGDTEGAEEMEVEQLPPFTAASAQAMYASMSLKRREHEACLAAMRTTLRLVANLVTTEAPPAMLVAEMFVDMPLPWEELGRALQLQEKVWQYAELSGDPSPRLTSGMLVMDWRRMRTPSWQYMFEYQQIPDAAIDWAAYVMPGRMIFPPLRHENWQVVYEEVGWSNTGKSVRCEYMELLHREPGAPVTRTGILSNNIEEKFGPSEVLGGIDEAKRVFACIHRDVEAKFGRNFPTGSFLVWAANEENPWPVKHEAPIIVGAPHTSMYGNEGLPQFDTNDNVNRRRLTVRNNIPVKEAKQQLKTDLFTKERLTLMIKSVFAYREKTAEVRGQGIWNTGVLPQYFHDMREVNSMANQPLVAFLRTCDGDVVELDDTARKAAASRAARAAQVVTELCTKLRAEGHAALVDAFQAQAVAEAGGEDAETAAGEFAEAAGAAVEQAKALITAKRAAAAAAATAEESKTRSSFMSMKRMRQHVDEFTNNNRHIRGFDWTNTTQLKQTMMRFGCQVITPAQCMPDQLPHGLRASARGQWILGLGEPDVAAGGGGIAQPQPRSLQQQAQLTAAPTMGNDFSSTMM